MLTGGCHCGAIRYRAEGRPYHPTLCHCSDCQRSSGAPVMAWFTVVSDSFHLIRGEMRYYESSPGVQRGFCEACGCSLSWGKRDGAEIDIATASLDSPEAVPPQDHTWFGSRQPWMQPGDALPRHATARGKGLAE